MRAALPASLAAGLFGLALGACEPLPSAVDAASVDADARGDASPDAAAAACDAAAGPLACEDLTPDPSCSERWVVGVRGRIVAAADAAPVEGGRPQLCVRVSPAGGLVCLKPPSSASDGSFTIVVPEAVRCMEQAAMRVLAPGQPFATTYCHVALGAESAVLELSEPFALHAVEPGAVPARGDLTMERPVVLAGGLTLELAPDAFADLADYDALASGRYAALPCDLSADVIAAWAFSPEVRLDGGAAITLDDSLGLAPDTEVELVIVGGLETTLIDGTPVPEAELGVIGTGRVSADGTRIETSARLPYLSWLGIRPR